MAGMSSTVRRRAWINSSRQQPTVDELDPEVNLPSASIVDDDVFSDGCFTGKIENWLLGCGSEACSETSQLSFESALKTTNFDDDLSLGADASLLNNGEIASDAGITEQRRSKQPPSRLTSTPRQQLCLPSLNLGHSMASSCLSSSTCKTTSSISEVLQLCAEDAEETLYELGFGCDEPQVTVRIPPRFFTFPSLSQGINFRVFLDSQLRRIREEDPSLSLASRFRQVQVLTAMANAFYSLYSHVSRTPVQKLATPEFTFSSSPVERFERFRSSVRSEPRSPVERLKDTVSKMCLYTGSPRGSDSTSPQTSPHRSSSLPDVVGVDLDKAKTGAIKKLDLGEYERSTSVMDVRLVKDGDMSFDVKEEQAMADTDVLQNGNKMCHKDSTQTDDDDDENSVKSVGLDNRTHSVRTSLVSSLSGETVIETDSHFISTQSDTRTADLKPVVKVTYDLICPQIVESVHQLPFCSQHTTITFPPISSEMENISGSCSVSHQPETQIAANDRTQSCINVTDWEEDDVTSCLSNTPDSCHTSTVPSLQICEDSHKEEKRQFLNPQTHQGLGKDSSNLQQVNSFELEEVHSAGEDDFGQSESSRTTLSLSSKKHQRRGEVVRGDSMQSDSSGYADEEVSLSSNTQSRCQETV